MDLYDLYPLWHTMPNGATVNDWLGTCASAARVAAMRIEDVRENTSRDVLRDLDSAEQDLIQALSELRAVRAECGRP